MSTPAPAPTCVEPSDDVQKRRIAARLHMRSLITAAKPKTPRSWSGPLKHGWLLPALLGTDSLLWGRWDHWYETMLNGGVLENEPIPQIEFEANYGERSLPRKWIEAALNCIPSHGAWQTWGGAEYFRYFLDWLLYGFGDRSQMQPPEEPHGCEGASDRLYQVFCLEVLLAFPADYFGDMFAEASYGRGAGFFPTPLCVCEMIVRMQMGSGDHRAETVMDPCVGTGRMLLCARRIIPTGSTAWTFST